MKRLVAILVACAAPACSAAPAADVFAALHAGSPPRILRHVEPGAEAPPAPAGVVVERVVFAAPGGASGAPANEVFAVVARPAGVDSYPGMLLLHGGGGNATQELPSAVEWARRGYVVVVPDLPGIANAKGAPHSAGAWTKLPYGEGRWLAAPDATASTIFQGVAAALQAFELLCAQPGVDVKRVGVTGTSWGGYATTMVCGILGDRVRAGFSNYGAGFYEFTTFKNSLSRLPASERERWYAQLDAGRRATGITAPFFIAGATNDTFFFPPAVDKTLAAIAGATNRVHAPNAHHRLPVPGGVMRTGGAAAMAEAWFAAHLQGRGEPFPEVVLAPAGEDENVITFSIRSSRPVTAASVWHSLPPVAGGWPKREWKETAAIALGGGRHEATLPAEALRPGAAWFALVSDDRPVSVSSPMVIRE